MFDAKLCISVDCEFLLHALAVKTLSAQRVAGFGWIFSIECSPSFGLSGSVFFSVFSLASLCITRAVGFFLWSCFRQVIATQTTQPWEAGSLSQHKKEHSM